MATLGLMTRLLEKPRTGRAPAGGLAAVEAKARATTALVPVQKLVQTVVRAPQGSSTEAKVLGAETVAVAVADQMLTSALATELAAVTPAAATLVAATLATAMPAAATPAAAKPAESRQRAPRRAAVLPEVGAAPRAAVVAVGGARPSRDLLLACCLALMAFFKFRAVCCSCGCLWHACR